MSTSDDYSDPIDGGEDNGGNGAANWRRQKEQEARDAIARATAAEAAAQANAGAALELAVLKAGIDTNTPNGKMFLAAYKGTPDLEAVKAQALEYGLISAPVPSQEQAAHERLAAASAGGGSPSQTEAADVAAQLAAAGDPMTGSVQKVLDVIALNGGVIDREAPGDWFESPTRYM